MTQKSAILDLFRRNGGRLTLGQLLQPPFAAAYSKRISELRREGFTIECQENHEHPTENVYTLKEAIPVIVENNQREWLLGLSQ